MKKNLVRAVLALLTIAYVASHFMPRAHAAEPDAISAAAVRSAGVDLR